MARVCGKIHITRHGRGRDHYYSRAPENLVAIALNLQEIYKSRTSAPEIRDKLSLRVK